MALLCWQALLVVALARRCAGILHPLPRVFGHAPLSRSLGESAPQLQRPANPLMSNFEVVQRLPTDPQVVFSLTTVPGGVHALGPTLRSLRNQSFPADAIELNLPWHSRRGLGVYPQPRAEDVIGVDVYRTDDWISLTNVVPTVQRAWERGDNPLVIVVDDDKVYPPSLVEDHIRAHRGRPHAVSACRGYRLPFGGDLTGLELTWDELRASIYGHRLARAEQVAIVTGSDSWAARADLFTEATWRDLGEEGVPRGGGRGIVPAAEMMNDLWVSGHFSRQGVPKFVVPCQREAEDAPRSEAREHQNLPAPIERGELTAAVVGFFQTDWAVQETMASVDEVAIAASEKWYSVGPRAPPTLLEFACRAFFRIFHTMAGR